ncbi:MAG: YihY/virulence factor BrkB family protein [Pseudomonadota bacterium]|nr:YihY/virulence factor BrkB family protein [Pseudomonadota bacterium]
MMIKGVPVKQFGKELFSEIGEDNIFNGAAALAYYLTLAIFPAMIFVMAMIAYLPIANVDQAIMNMLRQAMPPSAAQMFSGVVRQVTTERHGGLLSFGAVAAIWATSSGMYAIMQQLNITYDVDESRGFIRARLTAIGLSLLFTVLVIGGFSLIVLGGQIQGWLIARFGFGAVLLTFFAALRWVIIVLGLLLGFALIYYLAPNVKQRFRFITYGSVIAVVLLAAASLGFAWYTSSFANYSATYGSVGAVIVLMLWLYITGLVLLIGPEVNALIEHHSVGGKNKGERKPGEGDRDAVVRERVRQADPDIGGASGSSAAGGHLHALGDASAGGPAPGELRRVSMSKTVLTMLTAAVLIVIGRRRQRSDP